MKVITLEETQKHSRASQASSSKTKKRAIPTTKFQKNPWPNSSYRWPGVGNGLDGCVESLRGGGRFRRRPVRRRRGGLTRRGDGRVVGGGRRTVGGGRRGIDGVLGGDAKKNRGGGRYGKNSFKEVNERIPLLVVIAECQPRQKKIYKICHASREIDSTANCDW